MSDLSIKNVYLAYEDDEITSSKKQKEAAKIPVLKDLNIDINEGEFVCLIGHSGCGKTTLLKILAGLLKPTKGEVLIGDNLLDGPGLDRSVVFQNYALFPWMSVLKNVEFGVQQASKGLGRNLKKDTIKQISLDYLHKVSMQDAVDLHPYQLSGGMQQRVAIARALAMDTEILLFDEPFGALDVKTRRELQSLMNELWLNEGDAKKTAVFVTHDIDEALLLADRIVFMSEGQFVKDVYIDAPRPRDPDTFVRQPEISSVRDALLELFYETAATAKEEYCADTVSLGEL